MNIFLEEVSMRYKDNYILLVVDNALWHKSKELIIPSNIKLFHLLPYTLEIVKSITGWDWILNILN